MSQTAGNNNSTTTTTTALRSNANRNHTANAINLRLPIRSFTRNFKRDISLFSLCSLASFHSYKIHTFYGYLCRLTLASKMLEQRKTAHGHSNENIRVRFYVIYKRLLYVYVYQYYILLKCAFKPERSVSFIEITHRIVYTTACYPLSHHIHFHYVVCFYSVSHSLRSLSLSFTFHSFRSFVLCASECLCVLPVFICILYINKILSIFVRHFLIKFDDLLYFESSPLKCGKQIKRV